MKLPSVRFTVRLSLIAVALIAITLWLMRLAHLSGVYGQWAAYHAKQEREIREKIEVKMVEIERIAMYPEQDPVYRHLKPLRVKNPRADYHAAMRHKYEGAARRPLFPLPPDPPLP